MSLELCSQARQGLSILCHNEQPRSAFVQAMHNPRPDDAILPAGIPVLIWQPCRQPTRILMVICRSR